MDLDPAAPATPAAATRSVTARPLRPPPPRRPASRRPSLPSLLAQAAVTAAVVVGVLLALPTAQGTAGPLPVLPDQVLGVPPATGGMQIAQDDDLLEMAREQVGAPVAARTYARQGPGAASYVNVLATRADMTGHVDLTHAGPVQSVHGGVSCTRTLTWEGASDDPGSLVLCWQTSEELSVTALSLSPGWSDEQVASVVARVWADGEATASG